MSEIGLLNVMDFGAKGDGEADDTDAIQRALDAAGENQSGIFIPAGVFLCGELRVPSKVELRGLGNWAFQTGGGSTLKLNDKKAKGLLNLTGALGVKVRSLCLDGSKLPGEIHGILFDKPDWGVEEDTPLIEGCRVAFFSGDGAHLRKIWCFTIRGCHFFRNDGWGVMVRGWDGFVSDNWFTCNGKAGFGGHHANSKITFSENRIEWNQEGGLISHGGKCYTIVNNSFDMSFESGVSLLPRDGTPCQNFVISGNLFHRSGRACKRELNDHESAHVRLMGARGVVLTGNTMYAGQNDRKKGAWSPDYSMVLKDLEDCVIKDNVMYNGSIKGLVADLGGHGEGVIVKDNVGRLMKVE